MRVWGGRCGIEGCGGVECEGFVWEGSEVGVWRVGVEEVWCWCDCEGDVWSVSM